MQLRIRLCPSDVAMYLMKWLSILRGASLCFMVITWQNSVSAKKKKREKERNIRQRGLQFINLATRMITLFKLKLPQRNFFETMETRTLLSLFSSFAASL